MPRHEETRLLHAAKGADQPAHPCSLISAFVFGSPKSIIAKLATYKGSVIWLVSVAEQTALSCTGPT